MANSSDNGHASAAQIEQAVLNELRVQLRRPLAPGLHLVSTPIGNLGDISLRALAALTNGDLVYCEDRRHSRKLLNHFGIAAPLRNYEEHSAERERPHILAALGEGKSVVLVSDAGTPSISDPGFKLVRACAAEGYDVHSVPGPCAAIAALSLAGLPTDRFVFEGFAPVRSAARRQRLQLLAKEQRTLVFYEAPQRITEMLNDMQAVFGDRRIAIAREITKLHQDVVRGDLAAVRQHFSDNPPRGEFVVVVGGAGEVAVDDDSIRRALVVAMAGSSMRDAVTQVAEELDVRRRRIYDLALAIRSGNTTEESEDE